VTANPAGRALLGIMNRERSLSRCGGKCRDAFFYLFSRQISSIGMGGILPRIIAGQNEGLPPTDKCCEDYFIREDPIL
jgi:hypothetical protein